ncbi:NAD(P)-dependent alcohol dehydrogenase [Nocardioides immobilis]|uniref:NAD(P)-dependent alcohol dehydrogenase n=1 Tax=Nocardioides immobilis TaxID=2049295 RepID=A0A417Y4N3_9ACTN|nr:NAD(P)-dependent alcohol dehydrogenase [Nocardioides immobilis]RHW27536.1 NAD(P)-dependent alcohol dehydrogenase [Nocardioides immobilis]
MRAAIIERYGPPEQVVVTEVPVPEPGKGEVLVRVEAVAVTAGDARIRGARFPRGFGLLARVALGIRGPRRPILGGSLSGTVERVGPGVVDLAPGDEVAGMNDMRMGGHAEYVVMPAGSLVRKPATVRHEDAAGALFGGTTALHFLRDRVGPGSAVLVNGASGAVGTSALQLAKLAGAEVTAVSRNHELVTQLGADHVIDYTRTPLDTLTARYDVVFDAVGNLSRAGGLRLLTDDGVLILAVAGLVDTIRARGRVVAGPASERAEDVGALLDHLASGRLDPVTEVVGGLDAIVEAHRRIDGGHKIGNLVVKP